ncbi:hypothetical protein KFL_004030020 [Klebsormidium nitens]|uniref:Sperm-tail PG-rich repeat-containing protein 2 n=1 Tax=Klebsormidium nitens TaxID=105231 RepID=A0A1Y1IDU8_KLENI|nr:hypothetical protein KFL_004030020 [Klebsormidium nitens]|eukprot:GAQ88132.1 hypothetical protein KFL_004030020 [Klebsormidium nitens]
MYAPGKVVERQVGGRRSKKETQGNAGHAERQLCSTLGSTAPTIPSKHPPPPFVEEDSKAPKGFSKSATRFAHSQENEVPGPGFYHRPASPNYKSDSLSKLGYGSGFVSKEKRFRKKEERRAPGPGFYTAEKLPPHLDHNWRQATSPFLAPPKDSLPLGQSMSNTPGPGEYEPLKASQPLPSCHSAFWSRSSRMDCYRGSRSAACSPAPGSYKEPLGIGDVSLARTAALGERVEPGVMLPSAAFRSTSLARGESPTRSTSRAEEVLLTSLDPAVPVEREDEAGPGPGSYEPLCKSRSTSSLAMESSMFAKTIVDRFGKPFTKRKQQSFVPGPGTYEPSHAFSIESNVARAAFSRQTERDMSKSSTEHIKPPGPAYYNPTRSAIKTDNLFNRLEESMWTVARKLSFC